MYISRFLEEQVRYASRYYPVVLVCGQRQVGKSTMLNHIKEPQRTYVTLDDANARRLAETDPQLFFETYGTLLLIDEVQRAPSLLLEIKNIVDEKMRNGEDCNGTMWLTGSQRFSMMKGVTESLAGRIAVLEMSGLSTAELENRPSYIFNPQLDAIKDLVRHDAGKNIHQIYQRIFRGSMPLVNVTDIDRDRYYTDYVNTYLERDVQQLAQVGKIDQFYDFLVYMASITAQELNYSEIAKRIGITSPTAKAWVTILRASGIIFILHPYSNNISNRLVKTPKVYFMDTGLAAYLLRWPTSETIENGAMDGAFLETYVVTEIVKSFQNNGKPVDIFYYRDIDRKELDLVMVDGAAIYPIEIKKHALPTDADKNFGVLSKFKLDVQAGIVLCMTKTLVPLSRKAWLCPISAL